MKAKIIQVGDSLAVKLPDQAIDQLHVGEGDTVYLTLSQPADGLCVSLPNPDLEQQLAKAREIMKRRDWVLRELAK